jgi:hypothetical protein
MKIKQKVFEFSAQKTEKEEKYGNRNGILQKEIGNETTCFDGTDEYGTSIVGLMVHGPIQHGHYMTLSSRISKAAHPSFHISTFHLFSSKSAPG